MWEPFTDEARRSVCRAGELAEKHRHSYLGAEHLVLGMIDNSNPTTTCTTLLTSAGIDLEAIRQGLLEISGKEQHPDLDCVVFSAKGKEAIEAAFFEARGLGHNYIGTEHLLLGIVGGDSQTATVLKNLGATLHKLRASLEKLLHKDIFEGKKIEELEDELADME